MRGGGVEGRGRRGGGGGVLMLFLRDGGEGRVNPPLTASSKEEIPSVRPSPPPFTSHPAVYARGRFCPGGAGGGGCWVAPRGPAAPRSSNITPLPLPPSPPASFVLPRCCYLLPNHFSSPSSLHPSLSPPLHCPPPHHAPIIFRAPS